MSSRGKFKSLCSVSNSEDEDEEDTGMRYDVPSLDSSSLSTFFAALLEIESSLLAEGIESRA
jgi:hypothetical protein